MKLIHKGVIATLLALLVAGTLNAQPAAPAADPAPAPAAPTSPTNRLLSTEEMKLSVTTLQTQVRTDNQHVQHLQAVVRKEKDVIKLSCVNDKYVKLKAEANLFDKAVSDLLGVIDRDDRHTAYTSTTQAADRVHKAREEADACVGEKDMTGESGNSFTPPDIVDDPTTDLPFDDFGTVVEPPVYASPYT
jgi:hypothetical protein